MTADTRRARVLLLDARGRPWTSDATKHVYFPLRQPQHRSGIVAGDQRSISSSRVPAEALPGRRLRGLMRDRASLSLLLGLAEDSSALGSNHDVSIP